MKRVILVITILTYSILYSYCQSDSLAYRSAGIGIGYYHYASINEVSDPYIFAGGNINYLVHFRSITGKHRFDFSFNYAATNRKPLNTIIPDKYLLINRDDGHIYSVASPLSVKHTQNINLIFGYYKLFKHVLFKDDYLGIGASERTSAVLTKGTDDPELVSSSLNPGIIYNVSLKHSFNLQVKSNLSLLSIYIRKPYASVEADLTTKEKSDFEFIKDNLKLTWINDYVETFSELELSKKISGHFDIQLNFAFIYLNLKSPRQLTSVTNNFNIGGTYKF